MAEFLVVNLAYENRMILAQYIFIITLIYLAAIIIIVGIGQRTRNLIPSKQSKIRLPQQEESETIIWKSKTGTVPSLPEIAGKKQNIKYQEFAPFSTRQPVTNTDCKRRAV